MSLLMVVIINITFMAINMLLALMEGVVKAEHFNFELVDLLGVLSIIIIAISLLANHYF